ncbi:MAG: hypothetical protein JNM62_06405 [Flavobacteriales bacterium]|nr:hypothetical protein [Flavobacteriales bacterium]
MKNSPIFLRSFWTMLVLAIGATCIAQQRTPSREVMTLHVEGLTSATRDAITSDLHQAGDLRVVFACVPAGVIVLEARNGQNKAQIEERTRILLSQRAAHLRARTMDQSLAQAEAACEQARNR